MTAPLDLDAAEKLSDSATPGPWIAELDCFDLDDGIDAIVSNEGTTILFKSSTDTPIHRGSGPDGDWTADDSAKRDVQWAKARDTQELRDARFIAAARTLVPDLIRAVREARAERDAAVANAAESQRIASTCVGLTEMQTAERIATWADELGPTWHGIAAGIRAGKWKP